MDTCNRCQGDRLWDRRRYPRHQGVPRLEEHPDQRRQLITLMVQLRGQVSGNGKRVLWNDKRGYILRREKVSQLVEGLKMWYEAVLALLN